MSKLTLAAALAALAFDNDHHWTEDGLPRLDILSALVGKNVTREQATAAAPTLTRASAQGAAAPAAGVGADTTATAAPAAPQAPAQGGNDGTQDASGNGSAEQREGGQNGQAPVEEDEIAYAQRYVDDLTAHKAKVDRELAEKSAALDRLIEARDAAAPSQALVNAVGAYHASQKLVREERARRINSLKGVNLGDILPSRSPIDQALRNRPRGR